MVIVSHGTWFDSTTCKVEVVSSGSVGGCSGVVVVVGDGGGVGRQTFGVKPRAMDNSSKV